VNSPTANDREKFGTYTRESATGLDYAIQRYYTSTYGRFVTADRYQASARGANNPAGPQSWNRYTYVMAIQRIIPTGRDATWMQSNA